MDDKINHALVQRELFYVSDSLNESLTSAAASDDSTFLDDLKVDAHRFKNLRRSGAGLQNNFFECLFFPMKRVCYVVETTTKGA